MVAIGTRQMASTLQYGEEESKDNLWEKEAAEFVTGARLASSWTGELVFVLKGPPRRLPYWEILGLQVLPAIAEKIHATARQRWQGEEGDWWGRRGRVT
ncbi:hypothetical protein ACLOJK_002769 [Asimina triloba]